MFFHLKLKLKLYLFISLTIVLCLLFLSIYISYSTIMQNDFSQKSILFSTQKAKNIELKMDYVEQSTNVFLSKYNLGQLLNSDQYIPSLTNDLRDISRSNLDIQGAFICKEDQLCYYTSNFYPNNFQRFVIEQNIKQRLSNRFNCWIYIKSDDLTHSDFLFYVQDLTISSKESPQNYLAVQVSIDSISSLLLEDQKNYFFEKPTTYMVFENGSFLLADKDKQAEHAKLEIDKYKDKEDKVYVNNDIIITNNKIEGKNITLVTYLKLNYINFQLNLIKLFLILLLLIILIIGYCTIKLLAKEIIDPLEHLYTEMKNCNL